MIFRIIILTFLVWFDFFNSALAEDNPTEVQQLNKQKNYNQILAEQLGADDYGMKMYVMAFLKQGPNRDQSPAQAAELQKAHMSNIKRMAENGELVLAGPFGANELGMKGIYIFNVQTVEEARVLTATDPAIKAGSLVMDLLPWYGSAALMQVNEVGQNLAKKSF